MIPQLNRTGYFGKLPVRGDFIQRNLPNEFISLWDNWLQTVISASQKTLNDNWLNTYLVSPIWRFFITLENGSQYTGIMLPSVDKVGRYFPFTIATQVKPEHKIISFVNDNADWYYRAEEVALLGLEENINYEQLNQAIDNLSILEKEDHGQSFERTSKAYHVSLNDSTLDIAISRLQSRINKTQTTNVSYWWNQQSDNEGDMICYLGMPDDNIYVAMLDGQWQLCHINHIDAANRMR